MLRMFKTKECSKKENFKEVIESQDLFLLMRKDNRKLIAIILGNTGAILLLAILLFFYKEPKIKILRLYDNPSYNETITISEADNRIRKQDIYLLVRYVVEHLDLKSNNTVSNFSQLCAVAEGDFLKQLIADQNKILATAKSAQVDNVYNTVKTIDFETKPKMKLIIATVTYSRLTYFKNGSRTEEDKTVKLALKLVDRKEYAKDMNLGGWYYGLMVVQIDASLDTL